MLITRNEFAAHHVRPVEARRLKNPPLWLFSRYDSDPILCPPILGDFCLESDDVIPQEVATVHHIRDLRLCQEHGIIFPLLDGTNLLGDTKTTSVPNVVRTQVEYHEAGRPESLMRRHQVKEITDMPYWSGETYGNISPLTLIHLESLVKMRCTTSHRIY